MDATLRQGSKGNAVVELQQLLQAKGFYIGKIDGDFGVGTANAVLKFQKANGLTADGIVGKASWAKLQETSSSPSNPPTTSVSKTLPTLSLGSQGQSVAQAQQLLKTKGYYQGRIDGDFGAGTRDAIIAFQRANGLTVDGKVGVQTWQKLQAPAIADVTPQPTATPPTDVLIVRPPVATQTPTPSPSPNPPAAKPTTPSSVFVPATTGTNTDTTPVNSIPSASAISLVDAANIYSRAKLPNQTVAINNLQDNISPEILQQFLQRWQVASGQVNIAPSLQEALSTYNSSQMLNQNLALQWLHNQLLPQALDQFRQDWANLNVSVGTDPLFIPTQPTPTTTTPQLLNLTDAVKVYKRTPSQVIALDNLQASVPESSLQQFFQRWSTASEQSAIAISLLDVFQDYNSHQFPSQVTALQWLEKELTSAQLEKFSRDWQA
ncbi:MAG: peptidoglycan-binding protein [Pseudanabaena sp. M57BS1SP1A06MG]|nr:peptidoglycan-binding protein [Pseudanabaena sp. M53BS1SP1A06MG]MCA6584239.1 peptidoglycan-binding protein [Pseudanabaena sp. M34BS1SP1A06MG]MCA6592937.1 peptidoglycan-binding protein [Pseudanabaena sp. M38BS1SP1A06MG]MCA6601145.1 peptidoglycan-binding protein [Pseudanabaena sp. M57BS1SP1A06MG]